MAENLLIELTRTPSPARARLMVEGLFSPGIQRGP
jgi:hypothetical protein